MYTDSPLTDWRKSTRSAAHGSCIEVRRIGDDIQVRDSKNPSGPILAYAPHEWAAFLAGAKHGEFDDLI